MIKINFFLELQPEPAKKTRGRSKTDRLRNTTRNLREYEHRDLRISRGFRRYVSDIGTSCKWSWSYSCSPAGTLSGSRCTSPRESLRGISSTKYCTLTCTGSLITNQIDVNSRASNSQLLLE